MEQRTCNIIMCCKGHCMLDGKDLPPLEAVAAYMSKECACPREDYKGHLLQSIMTEALFDFMNGADKPGYELRQMFYQTYLNEPTLSERIATMFGLTTVKNKDGSYANGFTQKLIDQSKKFLANT